jgi:hypothetical protein
MDHAPEDERHRVGPPQMPGLSTQRDRRKSLTDCRPVQVLREQGSIVDSLSVSGGDTHPCARRRPGRRPPSVFADLSRACTSAAAAATRLAKDPARGPTRLGARRQSGDPHVHRPSRTCFSSVCHSATLSPTSSAVVLVSLRITPSALLGRLRHECRYRWAAAAGGTPAARSGSCACSNCGGYVGVVEKLTNSNWDDDGDGQILIAIRRS